MPIFAAERDRNALAHSGLYVQYGCGLCAPDGWLNFDASPRLRLEKTPAIQHLIRITFGLTFPKNARAGNIVLGLPVPDGAARGVYCSHVLEHLPRDEVPVALRNTFRMLRPSGVFRLVVPDLRQRIACYLRAEGDASAADALIDALQIGTRKRPNGLMASLSRHFGNSAHLWMYDFPALKKLLEECGFCGIRRCKHGDSDDPMFNTVEDIGRFFDDAEPELAIEAIRPADPDASLSQGQCAA